MIDESLLHSKPFEVELCENPTEVAEKVFDLWKEMAETTEGTFIVAAPLSSTPLILYKMIVERCNEISNWKNFRFLFMDEMLEADGKKYVDPTDKASYLSFAISNLLGPLAEKCSLDLNQIIMLPKLNQFSEFESDISAQGGVSLLILATGAGGHFAQVVPGTPLESGFHTADLNKIPGYAQKHTKEGGQYEGAQFREKGMTLGYRQVLESKCVILMLTGTGDDKKQAAKELFSSDRQSFSEGFPISILYHPDISERVKVFISKETIS